MQLASSHLREVCAPGFDHDGLTGLRTRHALRQRINEATFGKSWTDDSTYRERFLCVDLDNFKRFLDVYGYADADAVLCDLAARLRQRFGLNDVYRFGGDEFVVPLGEREVWLPEAPHDVTVTHALVVEASTGTTTSTDGSSCTSTPASSPRRPRGRASSAAAPSGSNRLEG